MTVPLILVTVAHQGDVLSASKALQEPKREFLAVILDAVIAFVDGARLPELLPIAAAEFDPACCASREQLFAWRKVRHPNVIAIGGQISSPKARRKDTQSILPAVDRRINRFRSDRRDCSRLRRGSMR